MRRIALVLGLIVVLAGCGAGQATGGPTPTTGGPPAATPAGSVAASPPAATGAGLTLLSNWQKVDLTREGLQNMVTTLGPSNPQLAAALNQLLTSGQFSQFLLYALGYDGATYIGNVNITTFAVGALDLDGLGPLMEGQLKNVGVANYSATKVVLPAGNALLLKYTLTVHSGTTDLVVSGNAYIVIASGQAYQVTFSCNPPDPAACLAQGAQMIQTFRIGG